MKLGNKLKAMGPAMTNPNTKSPGLTNPGGNPLTGILKAKNAQPSGKKLKAIGARENPTNPGNRGGSSAKRGRRYLAIT